MLIDTYPLMIKLVPIYQNMKRTVKGLIKLLETSCIVILVHQLSKVRNMLLNKNERFWYTNRDCIRCSAPKGTKHIV